MSPTSGEAQPQVQRFKGLGEMGPSTLEEPALAPKKRSRLRVTIDDAAATDSMIQTLMGKEVAQRFQLIMERAVGVSDLDV